jgi:hypothetical protein
MSGLSKVPRDGLSEKLLNKMAPILSLGRRHPEGLLLETPEQLTSFNPLTGEEVLILEREEGFYFWLQNEEGYQVATASGLLLSCEAAGTRELYSAKGWVEGWIELGKRLCFWRGAKAFTWDEANGVRAFFEASSPLIGVRYVPALEILVLCTGKEVFWLRASDFDCEYRKELPIHALSFEVCPRTAAVALTCLDPCVLVAAKELTEPLVMSGYHQRLSKLYWALHGQRLVTVSDASIVTWRFDQGGPAGSRPFVLDAHITRVTAIAFTDYALFSGDASGTVFKASVETPDEPMQMFTLASLAPITSLMPEEDQLYAGNAEGELWLLQSKAH